MIKRLLIQHAYKSAFLWAIIIFALCAMPGKFIPSASWLELLSFDKWVHASVFFILVWLFSIGISLNKHPSYFMFFICPTSIIYGGLLEIMQAKVFSERSADWQDFVANTFGCIMALVFYRKLNRFLFK